MKIGFLLPTIYGIDTPGNGVRRQAQYQADALETLGHEVVRSDPWQSNDAESFDVIQFFMGGFAMIGVEQLPLKRAILVWAPMIDSNETNKRYRLASKVGEFHGSIYTVPGVFRRQAMRSDLIIARSTHERERVVQGLGIDAAKVRIALNGIVPPPADVNRARAADLTGWTEPFALHISTYTQARKNVLNLIRAIGPTGKKLAIAGTVTENSVLEQIRQLVVQYPNVKLLGYLSEADRNSLYAAARVFCLPSDHEGTGLAALEAAAYGAEIVITRNGGPPDYFGEMAHYVDPNGVDSIRAAALAAFATPPRSALRDRVLNHLTWKHSAESLVAAYEAAIASRRR